MYLSLHLCFGHDIKAWPYILSLSEKNGFPRQAIIWSAEKVPSIAGGVMEELSDMLGKLEVGDGKIMGEAQIKINILLEKESPRR